MRPSLAFFFSLFLTALSVEAQDRTFPYEAVVTQNQAEIYSGVGFYATDKLRSGTRVKVHRHDPGGWYVITPPPGSFSWIRADYVQPVSGRIGKVIENNVMVRVGSSLNNSRDVYQEKLSKDAPVEILGVQTLQTEQGPVRAYKIVPPQGEFRWIPGKYVTPSDKIATSQNNSNQSPDTTNTQNSVFQTPVSTNSKSSTTTKPASQSRKRIKKKPVTSNRELEEPNDSLVRHQQLDRLDRQFRELIKLETGKWNFTQLENGYKELRRENSNSDITFLLDQRLAAVKRYKNVKQEYDEFIQLTSETTRRDVHLLAMQSQKANQQQEQTPDSQQQPVLLPPQTQQVPTPIPVAPHTRVHRRPGPVPTPRARLTPIPNTTTRLQGRSGQLVPQQQIQNGRRPLFDGAGIIRRSTVRYPGAPRHVLTASDGRILAYLKGGWGTSLDRYVGKSMGVNGSSSYRPDLRSFLIRVRSLTPVHLSR